jgi:predicted nucleotidyltransferase
MTPKDVAEKNTILRVVVGSQAYGLSDGQSSDQDEKGVCIEPFEESVGLHPFDQYEYRSAVERTGKKDEPSGPGDLDLTIYSLKKFLKLALKGNPTIIEMFFITAYLDGTNLLGKKLQELYPYVVSKKAGEAYLGYMQAQKRKLITKENLEGTERSELVKQFGFDTKFAGHMIRLGMQGVELLQTGKLTLPMEAESASLVKDVRRGMYGLPDVLECADGFEAKIKSLMDTSDVRETPDESYVESWMLKTYWRYWTLTWDLKEMASSNGVH